MKAYKIIIGFCLLCLLGAAAYFYAGYVFSEAGKGSRSDHTKGLGILFIFGCLTWFYIRDLLQERKIRKTCYRK
jgi:hypothetical protein